MNTARKTIIRFVIRSNLKTEWSSGGHSNYDTMRESISLLLKAKLHKSEAMGPVVLLLVSDISNRLVKFKVRP